MYSLCTLLLCRLLVAELLQGKKYRLYSNNTCNSTVYAYCVVRVKDLRNKTSSDESPIWQLHVALHSLRYSYSTIN